jgi:hypothetical protein
MVIPVAPGRAQGGGRPARGATALAVPDRFRLHARLIARSAHASRRLRTRHRHSSWRELMLLAALYLLYDVGRFVVAGGQGAALARGTRLLQFEQTLNLAWEQTVNQFVSAHFVLAVTADYSYAALHYVITPVVLLWMWRAHRAAYPRARTVLLLTTIVALPSSRQCQSRRSGCCRDSSTRWPFFPVSAGGGPTRPRHAVSAGSRTSSRRCRPCTLRGRCGAAGNSSSTPTTPSWGSVFSIRCSSRSS